MEEDIKILEEFKKNGYSMLIMKYGDRYKAYVRLERALENLLTRYKQQTAELEKKEALINEMALAILNYDDQLVINKYKDINEVEEIFEEYLKDNANDVKEYFTNKVEREGK